VYGEVVTQHGVEGEGVMCAAVESLGLALAKCKDIVMRRAGR